MTDSGISAFRDRVAIVTGGNSGIGAATVRRLSEEGVRVASLDLRDDAANPAALKIVADVTDDESIRRAVASVADRFSRIDFVVNNAGIGAQGTVADNSDAEWMHVLDVNLLGIVRVSRWSMPFLKQSDAAAIVNVSSIAATAGLPARALYSASKGAVLALTRAMAADHLPDGVRVNCVTPGTADTPWIQRLLGSAADPGAERAALEARQPHGRLVGADEVAAAITTLLDPRLASVIGEDFAVDGGMHALRLRPRAPE